MNSLIVGLMFLFLTLPAHAYVDPNAGGIFFQILFPVLIVIAGAWALLKEKMRALFRKWTASSKSSPDKPV